MLDDGRAKLPQQLVSELTDALVHDMFDTTVTSLFGSVNYDVSEDVELSFAMRWDREERDARSLVPPPSEMLSTRIDYCNKSLGAVPVQYIDGCTLKARLGGNALKPSLF